MPRRTPCARSTNTAHRVTSHPALYRLEHQGLVTFQWGESENKRHAKYYSLTAAGRKRLRKETEYWQRLSGAIGLVLEAAPGDI